MLVDAPLIDTDVNGSRKNTNTVTQSCNYFLNTWRNLVDVFVNVCSTYSHSFHFRAAELHPGGCCSCELASTPCFFPSRTDLCALRTVWEKGGGERGSLANEGALPICKGGTKRRFSEHGRQNLATSLTRENGNVLSSTCHRYDS